MKKIDLIKLTKSLTGQYDIIQLIKSAETLHKWLENDISDNNVSTKTSSEKPNPHSPVNKFTDLTNFNKNVLGVASNPTDIEIENNRNLFGKNLQKEKKCIALTTIDLLNIPNSKKQEYKELLKDYNDEELIKFSVDNNIFVVYVDDNDKSNNFTLDIFSKYKTNKDTYILSLKDFNLLLDNNNYLDDEEKNNLISASGINIIGGYNSYSIEVKIENNKPVIIGKIYTKVSSEYNPNIKSFLYSKEMLNEKIVNSELDDDNKQRLLQEVKRNKSDFILCEHTKECDHMRLIDYSGDGYKTSMTNKEALIFINKLEHIDFDIKRNIIEKLSHKHENDIITIIYNYSTKLEIIEDSYSNSDIIIDGLPKMIINYKKKNVLQDNLIYTDSYLDTINDKIEKGWDSYSAFYGIYSTRIIDTVLSILLNKILYKENSNILYVKDESNKDNHTEILNCFKQQLNPTIIQDKTNNGDYFFIGDRENGDLFSCSINFCTYKDLEKITKYCKDNSKGYEYIIFDDCSIVSFSQVDSILNCLSNIDHNQVIMYHKLLSPDKALDIDERSLTYKLIKNYYPNKNDTYVY
ncbi:MAG: hypothetical protein [Caudoviricetes sp.]|nr:MAG: hypothetical protein [Caudoviricetes sp.]